MVDEQELSRRLGRSIKSPIRIGNLGDLGINEAELLNHLRPFFETLTDDPYLARGKQVAFLKACFPEEREEIEGFHKSYFEGQVGEEIYASFLGRLSPKQATRFQQLAIITRQRNISTFRVWLTNGKATQVQRLEVEDFTQDVDDFRVWKRVFAKAEPEAVEHPIFETLLKRVSELVATIHPETSEVTLTSHFMRTLTFDDIPGENSPEGIHEDGAQYIISALVVNRKGIEGAESQVYELLESGEKSLIHAQILAPGEFIFQADTGEETTFGNDLWHYVTPIHCAVGGVPGTRDIVGFDIELKG